jgi:leucyl aminopeptidase
MEFTVVTDAAFDCKVDGVLLFTYEEGGEAEERLRAKIGDVVTTARQRKEFEGKPKQQLLERRTETPRFYLLVGLGKRPALTLDALRSGAALGAVTLRNAGAKTIALELPAEGGLEPEPAAQAAVEGVLLGTYQFIQYRTQKLDEIKTTTACVLSTTSNRVDAVQKGLALGRTIAEACNLVRDLQNLPSSDLTPEVFAQRAKKTMKEDGVRSSVLSKDKLAKLGYGGIVGVGRGSVAEPCLVTLEYEPKNAKRAIALVGKGLTFDSGGISIKPGKGMGDMKFDMSGAAVVLGVMRIAARLKLPLRIVGVLALVENMPDGGAFKPGDIVRTKNGKTIEIDNTDAEGRVVLADALHHATLYRPDEILDVATLTGAATVTFGDVAAAVLGTDQGLVDKLLLASKESGEKVWQLPLWDEYAEDIKSQVADMKNVGMPGGMAGTIAGAMLLKEFVGEKPWAHLDIAPVAYTQGRERYFTAAGGTAFGVRLLAQYLRAL